MREKSFILNKWTFRLGLVPMYYKLHGMVFSFGIFKLTSKPPEGEIITKKNYKGFLVRKDFNGFFINF